MAVKSKKTYQELCLLETYEERFEYLRLDGAVGSETFGFDRYMNQLFYRSKEWKDLRDYVILRDNGCDLGVPGYEIKDKRSVRIHHMNPISINDLRYRTDLLLNPDYLITTTQKTHNAIHYGDEQQIIGTPIKRSQNDTCPWR